MNISKDSKIAYAYEREYGAFVFLGLGHLIIIIYSFINLPAHVIISFFLYNGIIFNCVFVPGFHYPFIS